MTDKSVPAIFRQYQTPFSLQNHLLSVAGLAAIIVDNWRGRKIDGRAIVTVCLFHDIAKPINFDLAKQAEFGMKKAAIEKLRSFQSELKSKYGENEHKATLGICRQIGFTPKMLQILDNLEWEYAPKLVGENDLESLIPIYCDMRIGPKGILPLSTRIGELKLRSPEAGLDKKEAAGLAAERLIQQNLKVDLKDITNQAIAARIRQLKSARLML